MAATKLVAKRLNMTRERRMMAFGDVEMIEPSGNRIYAEKVDRHQCFANVSSSAQARIDRTIRALLL